MYLINSKDRLSLLYNDKSILENHHISYTFRLLQENDSEIFENLSNAEVKDIRKKMIQMVLATDLSVHFYELGNFKAKIRSLVDNPGNSPSEEDKNLIMANVMHFADISNQTKKWDVCFLWTEYLYEEFWNQVWVVLTF
jgi:hypothetical protein